MQAARSAIATLDKGKFQDSNDTDVEKKTVLALVHRLERGAKCHAAGLDERRLRTVRAKRNSGLQTLGFRCDGCSGREPLWRGCIADTLEYIDVVVRVVDSNIGARGCVDNWPSASQCSGKQREGEEKELERILKKHRRMVEMVDLVSYLYPFLKLVILLL
jgi:hypothetical protein